MKMIQMAGAMSLAFMLAACGGGTPANEVARESPKEASHSDEGVVTLSADQISAAGVQVAALNCNLGESVVRGHTLAVIETGLTE